MDQEIDPTDFAPYFRSREVRLDWDDALMESVFHLRFQVYCTECNFLSPGDYPDRQERDHHDKSASHFCAFNLREGLVGYVRLVRADSSNGFPFQEHCVDTFEGVGLPPAEACAEVSRLMVRKDYRRREGDLLSGVSMQEGMVNAGRDKRNHTPRILLSMYRQIFAFSHAHGVEYWYAAMEEGLARAIRKLGIVFRQIGPVTNYYGPVAPYVVAVADVEENLEVVNPALLAWLRTPEVDDI